MIGPSNFLQLLFVVFQSYFQQILRFWYWEHCTGGMTTELFLRKLKKWEHAGFINSNVWTYLDDIVDRDAIRTVDSISTEDEFKKLSEDDTITDGVLSCVSRFIVASTRLQFALEILRLEYYQISGQRVHPDGRKMRSNLEVCHQYKLIITQI